MPILTAFALSVSASDKPLEGKRIAILATDGFEQVELTKPRQALLDAGARVDVIAPHGGTIQGMQHHEKGESVRVDRTLAEARELDYDALMLPGGVANPDALRLERDAILFVKGFVDGDKPIAAICHGPWTLIDAGGVRGKNLTSWPSLKTDLGNAGAHWVDKPVVVDGRLVTSRKPDDIPAFNKDDCRLRYWRVRACRAIAPQSSSRRGRSPRRGWAVMRSQPKVSPVYCTSCPLLSHEFCRILAQSFLIRWCMNFHILSFEGPDTYSRAGGIASRIAGLSEALAKKEHPTDLWFVGDPKAPGHEAQGALTLHRWCQWISRYHPAGVYDGENFKSEDYARSLPPFLLGNQLGASLSSNQHAVVLAEEWHTAEAVIHLDALLKLAGRRDDVTILWNANNVFGFDHIDWNRLKDAAVITTVSRYMRQIMMQHGVEALVIPNGIEASALVAPEPQEVKIFREQLA